MYSHFAPDQDNTMLSQGWGCELWCLVQVFLSSFQYNLQRKCLPGVASTKPFSSLPMGSTYFPHHPSSTHSALILVVWQNTRPIYIQAQLLHGNLCIAGCFLACFPSQILQEKSSSFKDFYKEASGLLCPTSMDMFRAWYMEVELPDSH